MRLKFLVLAATFCGAACAADVPAAWKNPGVMGHDFIGVYNANVLLDDFSDVPDLAMFEKVWYYPSFFAHLNDMTRPEHLRTYKGPYDVAVPTPEAERWKKLPYRMDDLLAEAKLSDKVAAFERRYPGCPLSFAVYDARGWLFLQKEFPADREDFAAWRARHPSFYCFQGFDEYDNDLRNFLIARRKGKSGEFLKARWNEAYPMPKDFYGYQAWTDEAFRRISSFFFTTKDLDGLVSIYPTACHEVLRAGAKFLRYESEMGSSATAWTWGAMCARGAARQFGIPWGWYGTSYVHASYTRDGRQVEGFIQVKRPGWAAEENLGCSRSLFRRQCWYGYLAGAATLQTELFDQYCAVEGEGGKLVPSVYVKDINGVFEWNKTHDRGVPYTPVALLLSVADPVQCQLYRPFAQDKITIPAFLETLVPTRHTNLVWMAERNLGREGSLFNSPFGEFCDILSPDVGQRHEDFVRALRTYSRAFLVGWFGKEHLDTAALVEYVKDGGTLYVEQSQVDAGLVPASVPDAKGSLVVVPSFLPESLRREDVPWWPDRIGKLASGEETCPVIRDLLMKAQEELLPVKVEGDIQWGVNRTGKGWLVWLINNRGVTKYALEPEIVDPSETRTVRVTFKPTGRVYEKTVRPGCVSAVVVED